MLADDRADDNADGSELWRLLRSLDDPERLEHPAGFDAVRERDRFERLALRIEAEFGRGCEVDRQVQDASLLGRIVVPGPATSTGRPLVVSVSNFGGLAVLTTTGTGGPAAPSPVDPRDEEIVAAALRDLGYTPIPEEPLRRRYDGSAGRRAFGPRGTWWTRFFDYL